MGVNCKLVVGVSYLTEVQSLVAKLFELHAAILLFLIDSCMYITIMINS